MGVELESEKISRPKLIEHPWNMRELIAKQDDFDQQNILLQNSNEQIFRLKEKTKRQQNEIDKIRREKEKLEKDFKIKICKNNKKLESLRINTNKQQTENNNLKKEIII